MFKRIYEYETNLDTEFTKNLAIGDKIKIFGLRISARIIGLGVDLKDDKVVFVAYTKLAERLLREEAGKSMMEEL